MTDSDAPRCDICSPAPVAADVPSSSGRRRTFRALVAAVLFLLAVWIAIEAHRFRAAQRFVAETRAAGADVSDLDGLPSWTTRFVARSTLGGEGYVPWRDTIDSVSTVYRRDGTPLDLIDDEWMARLARMPRSGELRELNLRGSALTDAGMARLSAFKNLTWLGVHDAPLTDESLGHIARCRSLSGINLDNTRMTDAGLARLGELLQLGTLELRSLRITFRGFRGVALNRLTHLYLLNTDVDDEGLAAICSAAPNLKRLHLRKGRISDAGVEYIGELHALEKLTFYDLPPINSGLRSLAECRNLDTFFAFYTSIGPDGLDAIAACDTITGIALVGPNVMDGDLARFARMPRLESLILWETPVTGAGFDLPDDWVTLDHLSLRGSRLNDAGLRVIARLPALTSLDAEETDVTVQGVMELRSAPRLESLHLSGFDEEHANRIRSALPRIKVVFRDLEGR